MDNNNNLPYGAVTEENQDLFTPGNPGIATQNLGRDFNPIEFARNTNLSVNANGIRQHGIDPLNPRTSSIGSQPYSNRFFQNNGQNNQNLLTGLFRMPLSAQRSGVLAIEEGSGIQPHDVQARTLNSMRTADGGVQMPLDGVHTAIYDINSRERNRSELTNTHLEPLPSHSFFNNQSSAGMTSSTMQSGKDLVLTNPLHRTKRKVLSNGSELGEPSSKQLITEERMAAKMHNLHISTDHTYTSNILLSNWDHALQDNTINNNNDPLVNRKAEKREEDTDESMIDTPSTFSLAPGIREMLSKKNPLLPQAVMDHINKPCLAIIPWKPPEELIPNINFLSPENKTDDEKAQEKESCKSEVILLTSQPGMTMGTDHVEVVGADEDGFDFDDMDL